MNDNKHDSAFQYTYSAKEQEELKNIRSKYMPKEESTMERLRRLDRCVTHKATIWALSTGIIGTLILGTGMSCCMVWSDRYFLPGILIGIIGMAITSAAYPLYNHVLKKERARVAPEIIRLTDELMK